MDQKLPNFVKFMNFYYYTGCLPYKIEWISSENLVRIIVPRSKIYKAIWAFISTLFFLYVVYINFSLISHDFSDYLRRKDYVKLTFHTFWSIGAIGYVNVIQTFHVVNLHDVRLLINSSSLLLQKVEREFSSTSNISHWKNLSNRILSFVGIGLWWNCTLANFSCLVPLFIFFRYENWAFGSIFFKLILYVYGEDNVTVIIGTLVGGIMEVWWFYSLWGPYAFETFANMQFLLYANSVLQALQSQLQRPSLISSSKVTKIHPEKHFRVCSSLQIMINIYNDLYGSWYIPPMSSVFTGMIVFGAMMALRIYTISKNYVIALSGICIIFAGFVGLTVFSYFGGVLHKSSSDLVDLLSKEKSVICGAVPRKLMNACKVLAIRNGSICEIRKITTLTILGLVSNITGSLLISIKF